MANNKSKSSKKPIQSSQLMKLFEDQSKDIYWAEKAWVKPIPKMINNATSQQLIDALINHLAETENQVTRVEHIYESTDNKEKAKQCEAMKGLIKEAEEIMESCEEGAMCDTGIISAGQQVDHYEIALYRTLRQFAETSVSTKFNLHEAALREDKKADKKLSISANAATETINVETAKVKA